MRKLGLALSGLVALVAIAAVAVAVWVGSARPVVDGRRWVTGLDAPVEVLRDSMGVPHIRAASERDALFAQGYVHAQDRLWQMQLFLRVAQGRLAEIMGPSLVESDRFLRTLGLWRAAVAEERTLPARERSLAQAYADGVNAFLDDRAGALPPEFIVLRFPPARWTVTSSLAIEKVMAWDLAEYRASVAAWDAARRLGPARTALALPTYPAYGPDILEATPPPPLPAAAAALLEAAGTVRASNSWVVAGAYTRSGKPILANDMHLGMGAPAIWQLQALHGGGLDVAGMTLPGVPYVIAGHNRAVAWGYTNAMLDDADLFLERLAADGRHYVVPGVDATGRPASAPLMLVTDSILVRGRERAVPLTIRLTRHGPLMEGVERRAGGTAVALRWASHDAAHSIAAIGAMNRARSGAELAAAVGRFDDPHQNVIWADTAGHIGYVMGGRVPLRGSTDPATARTPPLLPVPGWTADWDWVGWLPFGLHPRVTDPADGYVVTANNRQDTSAIARLITTDWLPPWRASRIREMIRGGGALAPTRVAGGWLAQPERAPARAYDAAATLRMQMDVHDARAERYLPRAIAAAEAAGLREAAAELRAWDGSASADSHAAAVFESWLVLLRRLEAESLYGGAPGLLTGSLQDRTLDGGTLPWDPDPAAYGRLAVRAMRAADSVARGKTWGDLNRLLIEHQLGSVRVLRWLLRLNLAPTARGGSPATVNDSEFFGDSLPVTTAWGPSERHVVDMSDVDGSGGFILPTGESGLPFDRHYRDMFPAWRDGGPSGLWLIPLDASRARARTVHRLTLQPAR